MGEVGGEAVGSAAVTAPVLSFEAVPGPNFLRLTIELDDSRLDDEEARRILALRNRAPSDPGAPVPLELDTKWDPFEVGAAAMAAGVEEESEVLPDMAFNRPENMLERGFGISPVEEKALEGTTEAGGEVEGPSRRS